MSGVEFHSYQFLTGIPKPSKLQMFLYLCTKFLDQYFNQGAVKTEKGLNFHLPARTNLPDSVNGALIQIIATALFSSSLSF